MCGRFTLSQPINAIASAFNIAQIPPLEPRYNIAPTQLISSILSAPGGEKQLQMLRWGLIPSWAKDAKISFSSFFEEKIEFTPLSFHLI